MKQAILIISLFSFSSAFLLAQDSYEPAEDFAESITAQDLKGHLFFLADDIMEGRATGTRGQKMAAHYIRSQFKKAGISGGMPDGSYYQTYYMNKVEVTEGQMKIGKKKYNYGNGFVAGGSGSAPESLDGDFVFVGYGIEADQYNNLDGLDLTDKIVIMIADNPNAIAAETNMMKRFHDWRKRQKNLQAKGARATMTILPKQAFKIMSRYAQRSSMSISDGEAESFYSLYLSEDVGDVLLSQAKTDLETVKNQLNEAPAVPALDFSKMKFSYSANVSTTSTPAENVLGYLEGTDKKDELLIITAHYDHIGIGKSGAINNGADDDGSGTSTILELAEAFAQAAQNGYRPRRSILFMTVSGEEIGLLGSAFYANHPIYPIQNTVVNLNIDMIGRVDKRYADSPDKDNYVYVIGSDKLSTELHEVHEAVNKAHSNLILDYTYNDPKDPNRYYYRSDHYNFASKGIPVIFYFTGEHEDYHKPTDDPDKIHYDKLAGIARHVFYTAWELANREERVKVDVKE